jgi:hypothetical protein
MGRENVIAEDATEQAWASTQGHVPANEKFEDCLRRSEQARVHEKELAARAARCVQLSRRYLAEAHRMIPQITAEYPTGASAIAKSKFRAAFEVHYGTPRNAS